jgi:hypothetical protein
MHTIPASDLMKKIEICDKVIQKMFGDLVNKFNEPFVGYNEYDGLYITYTRKDIALYIEFRDLNDLNHATLRWA